MKKQIDTILAIILLIGIAAIAAFYNVSYIKIFLINFSNFPGLPHISFPGLPGQKVNFEKFASEEDFRAYLEEAELGLGTMGIGGGMGRMDMSVSAPAPMVEFEKEVAQAPERVSTTTVQVLGIDEPDIVKTDGKEIYFSSQYPYRYWGPFIEEERFMPPPQEAKTKIIKAFPPEELAAEEEIDKTGNLLLKENILAIFSGDKIYGYDVSDPKSPQKKWTIELENNNYIVAARLYKGKIYLITSTRIDTSRPCPIKPLSVEGVPLEIKCIDIYHPIVNIPADVTYTALVLNPDSGEVEKNISFVGSSNSSIVYMSEGNLFITYSYYGDFIEFIYNQTKIFFSFFVYQKTKKIKNKFIQIPGFLDF